MYKIKLEAADGHCPLCEEPLGEIVMDITIDGIHICYMHRDCAMTFQDISERIVREYE